MSDFPEPGGRGERTCVVVVVSPPETAPLDAFRAVLAPLRAEGWAVTLLDASHAFNVFRMEQDAPVYQALAAAAGARYQRLALDGRPQPIEVMGNFQSYWVYEYLKSENPALVIGEVLFGALHQALNARDAGVGLSATHVWALATGTVEAGMAQRQELPAEPAVLAQAFMERMTVERATGVLCADDAARDWLRESGWRLPALFPVVSRPAEWLSHAIRASGEKPEAQGQPLVSVCLTHYERPLLLRRALASLEAQTYPRLEVVLVDDGSKSPEARACLDALEPAFAARGWHLVRQENAYLGAARNTAARHARGDYLLFMDDDNVARPEEVAVFVRAAVRTDADILTCFYDGFEGDQPPARADEAAYRLVAPGGPVVCGIFTNCWGDANALVRRETFTRVGGFTELRGVGAEDHEFFARAALAGCRMAVVPEALYWYRVSPTGMRLAGSQVDNARRALAPYREQVPPALAPLLELAPGWRLERLRDLERMQQRGEAEARLRVELEQSQAACRAAVAARDALAADLRGIQRSWLAAVWLPWSAAARARWAARRQRHRQ